MTLISQMPFWGLILQKYINISSGVLKCKANVNKLLINSISYGDCYERQTSSRLLVFLIAVHRPPLVMMLSVIQIWQMRQEI